MTSIIKALVPKFYLNFTTFIAFILCRKLFVQTTTVTRIFSRTFPSTLITNDCETLTHKAAGSSLC